MAVDLSSSPTSLWALSAPASLWWKQVNSNVPNPYLDEFFHIRQAQYYCERRFDIWDPKITTPPGLYILSFLTAPILGCTNSALRSLSSVLIEFVLLLVIASYNERKDERRSKWQVEHSAFNIALFPPLFFFAGLYYTDVASTFSVVLYYFCFLRLYRTSSSLWLKIPILTTLGLFSLSFRQTNIFWVAIFPTAIVFINRIDRGHTAVRRSMEERASGFGDTFLSIAKTSYKMEVVYDPPVRDASFEDYIKAILSMVCCTAHVFTNPSRLLPLVVEILPYLVILGSFVGFVVWNDGVVLGDRSNHVATLHLPQMLYIWPYFAFFSWPLIYPYLLTLPLGLIAQFFSISTLESMLIFKRLKLLPRTILLVGFVVLAGFLVHFNTIVHPFTLADNRHYTFYVFRLLTRFWWIKYAVTPIYVLCGWACIQALGARPGGATAAAETTTPPPPPGTRALQLPNGVRSATVSFVIVWMMTSALQLVTAPLVEPRYFILPWLFWRIHLPLQYVNNTSAARGRSLIAGIDFRLVLETVWHVIVNATTMYIFLHWEFEWPQEPGNIQRFMW